MHSPSRSRVVLAAALCAVVAAATAGAAGPRRAPRPVSATFDDPQACLEAAPAAASLPGVTDDGGTVSLDVLAVVDGLSRRQAAAVLATAARAFEPFRVRLTPRYRTVSFAADGQHVPPGMKAEVPTADERRLFTELIEHVGGARPEGIDVVVLLTNKDIWYPENNGERQYSSGGVAFCIGGVRFADKAFAIAEAWRTFPEDPVYAGKVAAHEIGHLMGAHHHYSNCVEGDGKEQRGVPGVCTVMEGSLTRFFSLRFGTVESAVIRGHAVRFAR
ncbi:MAG TPA: zinc-dependent metalloprotease family protein [Frankiaceae bacterium]|nr:zinc-dependent metalloprotease family protein [Frankiaceae bacterium]